MNKGNTAGIDLKQHVSIIDTFVIEGRERHLVACDKTNIACIRSMDHTATTGRIKKQFASKNE